MIKYILILFILITSMLGSYEQTKDTDTFKGLYDSLFTMSSNSDGNYVSMDIRGTDTVITVVGDSLTAIKLLFKGWYEQSGWNKKSYLMVKGQTKDTIWIAPSKDYVLKDGAIIGLAGIYQPFDSAKYYFKKHNYYKTKLEKIIKRMDENPYAVYDVSLFRLEDSCKKYKLLLTEYNKK